MSMQLAAVAALILYVACVAAAWRLSRGAVRVDAFDVFLHAMGCLLIGALLFVHTVAVLLTLLVLVCFAFGAVP